MPRQARSVTRNTLRTASCASVLPVRRTARTYWFSTSYRPDSSCRTAIRMPSSRSSGSKPVTTIGTRWRAAIGSYSVQPITAHTCPAARNACTSQSGSSSSAVIAGGTRTWLTIIEKFVSPRRAACRTAMALAGAVVSKPTARKTTSRSGRAAARRTASIGAYTTRTSAPRARRDSRSVSVPGTRSMSPKLVRITPGRAATAMARSRVSSGVTQTGQPGPWIMRIPAGSSSSMPWRTRVWV